MPSLQKSSSKSNNKFLDNGNMHFSPNSNEFEAMEDVELWRVFKEGNRLAFSYIYKKYVQALYAFGQQIVSDKELVKDSIHNLFIEVSKPSKKATDIKSIKSYLYKALYRLLTKASKERGLFQLINTQEQLEGFKLSFSEEKTLTDNESLKEKKRKIELIVNKLPTKQREAFLYFFYEGLSYDEIAYVMGMSRVHSARKLVYKAISTIKEKINGNITLISTTIVLIFILIWTLLKTAL